MADDKKAKGVGSNKDAIGGSEHVRKILQAKQEENLRNRSGSRNQGSASRPAPAPAPKSAKPKAPSAGSPGGRQTPANTTAQDAAASYGARRNIADAKLRAAAKKYTKAEEEIQRARFGPGMTREGNLATPNPVQAMDDIVKTTTRRAAALHANRTKADIAAKLSKSRAVRAATKGTVGGFVAGLAAPYVADAIKKVSGGGQKATTSAPSPRSAAPMPAPKVKPSAATSKLSTLIGIQQRTEPPKTKQRSGNRGF